MNTLFDHLRRMASPYRMAVDVCLLEGKTSASEKLQVELDQHQQQLAVELRLPQMATDKALGGHLISAYGNLFRCVRNINCA